MPPVVSPVLVGRATHMQQLEEHLTSALSGVGVIVFVSGEAGVGKSRLVRDFADAARARGIRALFGRAPQLGTMVPFQPFTQSLQPSVRDVELQDPSLERYRSALAKILGLESGTLIETPAPAIHEGL